MEISDGIWQHGERDMSVEGGGRGGGGRELSELIAAEGFLAMIPLFLGDVPVVFLFCFLAFRSAVFFRGVGGSAGRWLRGIDRVREVGVVLEIIVLIRPECRYPNAPEIEGFLARQYALSTQGPTIDKAMSVEILALHVKGSAGVVPVAAAQLNLIRFIKVQPHGSIYSFL